MYPLPLPINRTLQFKFNYRSNSCWSINRTLLMLWTQRAAPLKGDIKLSFEVRRSTVTEHYGISFLSVSCEVFRSIPVTTRRNNSHLIHFSPPQTLEISKPLCSGFRSIVFTHFQRLRRIAMTKCGSPICFPKSTLLPPTSLSAQSSSAHR
jgi:hypothetical protein